MCPKKTTWFINLFIYFKLHAHKKDDAYSIFQHVWIARLFEELYIIGFCLQYLNFTDTLYKTFPMACKRLRKKWRTSRSYHYSLQQQQYSCHIGDYYLKWIYMNIHHVLYRTYIYHWGGTLNNIMPYKEWASMQFIYNCVQKYYQSKRKLHWKNYNIYLLYPFHVVIVCMEFSQ